MTVRFTQAAAKLSVSYSLQPVASCIRPRSVVAMAGAKRIGTHSGTFHCDEALGCALLKKTKTFAESTITRSRDPEVWKQMDILIDVGGEYEPGTCRFDHHQRGFEEVFGHGFVTKLSSAGLVYKHYGLEIVSGFMGKPVDDPEVHIIWLYVYKNFIEAVDAVDNGVNQYEDVSNPRYVDHTTLSKRVGALNPEWNEPSNNDAIDARFADAVALTGKEFDHAVRYAVSSWLPARSIVATALQKATSVHSSGAVMVAKPYCPWKSHLYELEKEQGCEGRTLYVVYEDDRDGSWRLQAVSVSPVSFESRKPLPEAWRGVRDDELSKVTGIDGCVFAHASGFIGGNKTEEGIMKMAFAALGQAA